MYSKIKTIKSNAKEQLLSHMWTAVFFTFLFYLLTNLCSFCLMVFPGSESILDMLIYEFTTLMVHLFSGLLQVGVASFYLKIATGKERCSLFDLFHAFSNGPDRAIKVSFFIAMIRMLCTLPYIIYVLYFMPSYSMEQLLSMDTNVLKSLCIAYFILGMGELLFFLIYLFFEPIYFMLADMPGLSAGKAIKMSIWLMKGSKVRLLWLNLSFLPLQFVSLFTFGIGNLWVTPYINTSKACFYADLSAKRLNQ